MKVMILGADGYLGWPLSLRLMARGHEVIGVDNFATRKSVKEVGSDSAIPILSMENRVKAAKDIHGYNMKFYRGDITKYGVLHKIIKEEKPDTVVHFAEQRSAPYSMINAKHAAYTMSNNIIGTINLIYAIMDIDPKIHIVKMGTMGEFGTPNFDIPESPFVDVEINGRKDRITTPKFAGSWYHWTKVHDTNNILFANKAWKITTTDIMQGPVYGTRTKEITDKKLHSRFDFDEVWGTVVNRFTVESVLGIPLTAYGAGGQIRGYLSLEDSMEALRLLVENPPESGSYRSANQFVELLSINEIADIIQKAAKKHGIDIGVEHMENPRIEADRHYYNPEIKVLPALGFHPKLKMADLSEQLVKDVMPYKARMNKFRERILPHTNWRRVENAR
ncbi:MAG: NAD-dependent epimerase/dehydratase family protein [Candidatus Micrarchaeota archaeon]|nr:NAD-dependent epimerase/dehydratase family protein [Candidatus Micrarchaeota archaeon]MDE1858935.1 NAD-dependent epimerase/dehydratase family protein [Candidatus Micrarchaeota archaeon]